ncbi:MAG: hypothetical protein ACOCZU_02075, partial [Planctomycetota bacterium]
MYRPAIAHGSSATYPKLRQSHIGGTGVEIRPKSKAKTSADEGRFAPLGRSGPASSVVCRQAALPDVHGLAGLGGL